MEGTCSLVAKGFLPHSCIILYKLGQVHPEISMRILCHFCLRYGFLLFQVRGRHQHSFVRVLGLIFQGKVKTKTLPEDLL